MQSSIPFFNALAASYDAHFEAPHRRAYDDLAWEFIQPLLPAGPGRIIDAGCGIGRWAERLGALGHHVIGIEQAPAMAEMARARLPEDRFSLIEGSMEAVVLPKGQADLSLALGSLQYTPDPENMVQRLTQWTRVGGWIVVLVDSLVALVLELAASDKPDQGLRRLQTRIGTWDQGDHSADYHLFDRDRLVTAFRRAGLTGVCARGLLVGASAYGRRQLIERLTHSWDRQMLLERRFAQDPLLADLGKQLLVSGRREF